MGWVVSPSLRRGLGRKDARSAGRVQSVALRLVAEREQAIRAFNITEYFTLDAHLEHTAKPPPFKARLTHWKGEELGHRLATQALADQTIGWCQKQDWVVIKLIKEQRKRPFPPLPPVRYNKPPRYV